MDIQVGHYYASNQKKIANLSDADWRAALSKCKAHIRWRLKQKTLTGVHSASNLGSDPVDYYLGLAYEKIIVGEWEWKEEYSLSVQIIRIINSHISKEVEKAASTKGESFKIVYQDIEEELYNCDSEFGSETEAIKENNEHEAKLQLIEAAIAGDIQLEIIVEALKEGKKRREIADLLYLELRQFDKLRERLIRTVKNYEPPPN